MNKTSEHIRFGVICKATGLSVWQREAIEKLTETADIELKLVIFEVSHHGDNKILTVPATIENDTLFANAPNIKDGFFENGDGKVQLGPDGIDRIGLEKLDFIISFSSKTLTGKVLDVPKHGIWYYQFGNFEKYVGSSPFFWEIYHQDVVTSAYLLRLTEEPNTAKILHQGHLKTTVSQRKNSDKMLRECTSWPLKMCMDIRNNSSDSLGVPIQIEASKKRHAPSSLQSFLFPFIQFKLLLKKGWKQLFFTDYWNIGLVHAPIENFLDSKKNHSVQWFPNLPKTRFMADPFGLYINEQLHIVYEDLKFDEGIGKTARFLFEEGTFKENELVIDEEFHMSYPFLIKREGDIYCIPETYQANEVRIYKAVEFPKKWAFEKVLIADYAGIDSTLFEHEGTWFLFSTDKNNGPHHNLNIHYAPDAFGPWVAHPKNPVKTDIRSARPAGTLFEHNGELFRPSMDYSEKIEGRITINKVLKLTTCDFKEEVHNMIHPFENTYFSDKVHTLSKVGPYTLVDGAKELFIFSNFNAFRYKMKRVLDKWKKK